MEAVDSLNSHIASGRGGGFERSAIAPHRVGAVFAMKKPPATGGCSRGVYKEELLCGCFQFAAAFGEYAPKMSWKISLFTGFGAGFPRRGRQKRGPLPNLSSTAPQLHRPIAPQPFCLFDGGGFIIRRELKEVLDPTASRVEKI